LLNLGPTTIIEHQISNLRRYGIDDISIVVGHGADQVRSLLGDAVRYIDNEAHETTNSLYSLWLARDQARNGFVLLNGDVVFHPHILGRLLESPYPDALTVDRKDRFDEEQMKVALDGDRVIGISKDMDGRSAAGENLGLVKFSRRGARVLFEAIEAIIGQGTVDKWAPYAFNAIAPRHPIYGVDVSDLAWIEIDFPADLAEAIHSIYPSIQASTAEPYLVMAQRGATQTASRKSWSE
jgi:choline kinase